MRPAAPGDLEEIAQLSLQAWEPVFRSFEQLLGPRIYARLYPDWRRQQQQVVEGVCAASLPFSV
ncbi:MAG TPA: hypothetical protein VGP82_22965 [Ktedonobacterales bacterium]|nr:hypothetical protein [Ktedonobacterales bacterium]